MSFIQKLPKPKKLEPEPETAAVNFGNAVRKLLIQLIFQDYNPKQHSNLKKEIHQLRDKYNRDRGSDLVYSLLVRRADGINRKLLDIAIINPAEWNKRRAGQQFRRLHELLVRF